MAGIGSIGSAFQHAQAGLERGYTRMSDAAQRLAQDVDVEAIIDTKLAGAQIQASAKVASAVDENLGTLLDILA